MKLENWESTADLNPIYADLRALGLEQNIAEFDAFGFTVVPPEKVAPPEFQRRLLQAVLDVHERRTGEHIAIEDVPNTTLGGERQAAGAWALIGEDPIFEQAVLNPAVKTLVHYLLGKSAYLSEMLSLIKRDDERPTHILHTDQHGTPCPLPQYQQMLNVTWIQTDYDLEKGATAIVPGSHRFGRMPTPYEANFFRNDAPVRPVPIEAAAGSLIVWGGTTWHASFPRRVPGLRVSIAMDFIRVYLRPIRDMRREVAKEVLERNPPELARLLGMDRAWPRQAWSEGSNPEAVGEWINAGGNPWG